ncbi:restriction endonuclease subunit S [Lutispora saccharofermentans]|uniref:Restriction endonuclease subunit S n=1 Tax=Lutispora saccharofermentans TaxID=3024236 RepID=A0ABT1NN87_9FIRM|nr:restriction endonuclease subunit S [Lutispora saccharofermentans]MCQ1531391.1 restriction endonuclease subunit S [Lutispora saccharofermentans]
MGIELVELSNLLEYQKEFITINDEEEYKRCTAKLNCKGIVLRDVIKGKDIKTKKQQVCKAGQLLVAEIDAKVGGYGIVPSELEGAIVSSHYFLFNVNEEKLNRLYLHYYLKTDDFFNQIKPQGTTNYASIRPRDVLKIKIPLPSLERQKEIVEKLERFFKNKELFDKQNENNAEILNKLRQSILQEAVRGKLVPQDPNDEPASVLLERIKEEKERLIKEGKIKKEKPLPPISEDEVPYEMPRGWEWVRLGEISAIVGGGTPKTNIKDYWENGDIPWLTPADLSNIKGKYISKGRRNITKLGLEKSSAQLMPKGTVLFSSRAPIGYTAIASNPLSTNQGFKSCIPYVMQMNEYIYYYLTYSAKKINEQASGTTFKEVSGSEVANFLLPLPPLREQKRIVEKVDQLMALCDELERNIEQSKKDSELLMQSVLQEVFKEA